MNEENIEEYKKERQEESRHRRTVRRALAVIGGILLLMLGLIVGYLTARVMHPAQQQQQQILINGCGLSGKQEAGKECRTGWQGAHAVPEPGVLPLMALGGVAIAWMRREKASQ